jgi:uncharacterized FlaG/YvyC family protein
MDVQTVGAAEATPQQTPPVASPQGGQPPAPEAVPQSSPHEDHSGALTPVVAKLFAEDGAEKSVAVNVSYRVEHDPDIIVTVFTDPNTGQEIAQIPPEVMVQFAQFFDKQSGVTLDRSA